ncbi:TIGR00341 family protein [Thiomicrospira pelophila]|uniref:TIGR00341 family protein n=1 Tax=Thiomicrospira pelophila TaxID=934 RepID=UPI00056F8476|nr:TIGR00341 family protein [Thiomicrospira pelophila]
MKLIDITCHPAASPKLIKLLDNYQAWLFRQAVLKGETTHLLQVTLLDSQVQEVLDQIQEITQEFPDQVQVMVFEVESVIPEPETPKNNSAEQDGSTTYREQLYQTIEQNARLNVNYLVLVALSTVVAAIGMVEDNVAIIIGGMVIAPLLGPNLALGLATALADLELMKKSLVSGITGVGLAIGLSMLMALVVPIDINVGELQSRTNVELPAVVLALASGAAAALSVTTGVASVLVGVMVAVALLPPAVVFGLMLVLGHFDLALGAGLLLAVNIVSVNLSSKIVFFLKGIRPRTDLEQRHAKRSLVIYFVIWAITLGLLVSAIYLTQFQAID